MICDASMYLLVELSFWCLIEESVDESLEVSPICCVN